MTSHIGNGPAVCWVSFLFLLEDREVYMINVLSEIEHGRLVSVQCVLDVSVPASDLDALSVEVT